MKRLFGSCVLALALLSPPVHAGEAWINPLDKEARPIPGNRGMAYFHGEWQPWGDADALIFKSMTLHRDGRVTYDYWKPRVEPTERFKVIAEDEKTVLLVTRFWNELIDRFDYVFWSLTLRYDDRVKGLALYRGYCGDRNFGEAEWQKSPGEILAFFKASNFCEPVRSGSTEEYPWERWSTGYFSLLSG